ncbi:hypothetical protein V144x_28920 [Gimesia aquarii]|uniref:Uncharacterized protein n=1 Tax=Gimesia aquarii TaxID=2527964 RepID=A0A517VWP2_9PLAN|nr:hypothetical protein V144x_28920 [Gimesia aquarii]
MIVYSNRFISLPVIVCLISTSVPLLAEEPIKKSKASPVEARLIVNQSKYILSPKRRGKAFRKRIEAETDSDKLPAAPQVDLVLELKNISKENVMIWPKGAISYPDLTVKGPGVVQPDNLKSISGASSGSSIQPTIAPGKSYRLSIDSLNPNGGTPWFYWSEPGEYTITATYTVYTGLPAFPLPDDKKPKNKPKKYEVTTPPVKVKVILEDKKG